MATEALYAKRPAWLTFAAIVLISVGILRIISALYYFADSVRINQLANGAFENNLWLWGLWDLAIAALALFAAYSVLRGEVFGRIVAYAWAILTFIQSFMIIAWAPWFATAMLVLAALVVYGLAVTEDYREDRIVGTTP